ncbi:hypothetical protein Rleg9DRAFT_1732 [Rhizobium leguminosarum bv. trifolii WSM597]|uniref:Uncharacterized protein n=1 Tax=Rhizobium leguminosarum bv. trifolii WSM597 TaxID=754764 RepID=I9N894_RHILT|nr:hypothetical protein [Rhizobium leguminosarum]EJB02917.1 hypothetical protein Rleg9DRAFT_1732 [Rhizobium leguminosarum bv. trifolii WSM597]
MTKSFKERLEAKRLEKAQIRKRVLPLVAHYGRDDDFEHRRAVFYAAMAKAYGWEEWKIGSRHSVSPPVAMAGRDGRKAEIASIGRERATPIITNSAPLEYLFSKGWLQGKNDAPGAAHRRLNAGQRLRSIWEGAQISGLKAANLEGSSGGGVPGRLPGEYKMDCIRWLSYLRGSNKTPGLEQSEFSMVEDVVFHDVWLWEKVRADRRDRVILKLLKALDDLSVRFHMMTMRDFNARWYPASPRAEHPESPCQSPDLETAQAGTPSQGDKPQSE